MLHVFNLKTNHLSCCWWYVTDKQTNKQKERQKQKDEQTMTKRKRQLHFYESQCTIIREQVMDNKHGLQQDW